MNTSGSALQNEHQLTTYWHRQPHESFEIRDTTCYVANLNSTIRQSHQTVSFDMFNWRLLSDSLNSDLEAISSSLRGWNGK